MSLPPPPRNLPLFSRLTILSGGMFTQIGWATWGFGMIFFWVFTMNSEAIHLLSLGSWELAEGVVVEMESTGASENEHLVYRHRVRYQANGQEYESQCYFSGVAYPEGTETEVEYKRNNPSVGRIPGSRREMFSGFAAFAAIFPLLGMGFILFSLRKNSKSLDLLIHGLMTRGRFLETNLTNTTVNNIPVYNFTFSFKDREGKSFTVSGSTHEHHLLKDEETERILYWPKDPNYAVLYDLIPGAPEILPDGNLGSAKISQAKVLILPLLSLLVNGAVAMWWFELA